MSDARGTAAVSEGRGEPAPSSGDVQVVALAAATWIGAQFPLAVPGPAKLCGALAVLGVAGWSRRRESRTPQRHGLLRSLPAHAVLTIVGTALIASLVADRSLDGLSGAPAGPFDGAVVLLSDPEARAFGGVRFEGRVGGRRVLATATAPAAAEQILPRLAGERVVVTGRLAPLDDPPDWLVARHVQARLEIERVEAVGGAAPHAAAANAFRRMLDSGAESLPDRHRALLAGLTLGDDRAQPPELAADFRAAGLTHLLAVSGQNVAFVLAVAGPLIVRLRIWPRLLCSVSIVVAFAFVTRFEPSVTRAAAVAAVALTARTLGRGSGGVRHLAIAVTGLLLVDPLLTRSVGFRLSVAACVGVLLISPRVAAVLRGPRWLREGFAVTVGAQLAVAPVLVPTFGPMPLAAIPANVLAGPVAGMLMVWGVSAGTVAGLFGGPVAVALHLPSRVGLEVLERIASSGAGLPLGLVDLRHLVVLATAVGLVRVGRAHARVAAAVLVAIAALVPGTLRVPPGAEQVGAAATVWTSGPVAVVDLDAGASPVAVLDSLRRRQVARVAVVVVRSGRAGLAPVVESIRRRFPVDLVVAPPGSPVTQTWPASPGTRIEVGDLLVVVDRIEPTVRARVGWRS